MAVYSPLCIYTTFSLPICLLWIVGSEHECAGVSIVSRLTSFKYMSKSGMAGSYGNSIFSFLSKCYTDFYPGWTSLLVYIDFFPSHIFVCISYCLFPDESHSDYREMEFQNFVFAFNLWLRMLNISSCVYSPFVLSLGTICWINLSSY
jgi:hypothetical protein